MKKTIASIALLVSSTQAMALIGPGPAPKTTTICVQTSKAGDGSKYVSCDATMLNQSGKAPKVKENGCPSGQLSLTVVGTSVGLDSCLPPGFAQL